MSGTNETSILKKIVYSAVSGAIATTCIYPIDLTKTILQDQKEVGAARAYTGPIDCARKLLRQGGITRLYSGWPPNVLLVMPEKALKLTCNDIFRQWLACPITGDVSIGSGAIAGGMAGTCQVLATNPMELLKIQGATMASKVKAGLMKPMTYGELIKSLGVSGLYTGVAATLMRDVPFSMAYFAGYGALMNVFINDDNRDQTGRYGLVSGMLAGTVCAAATTPVDVIKTRVHSNAQPQQFDGVGSFLRNEVTLVRGEVARLLQNEGAGALIKGVVPRSMIIGPLFAITMTCFETFKSVFG
jgi:solute carrier family 25 aspartate/glutamate transporter 12/13